MHPGHDDRCGRRRGRELEGPWLRQTALFLSTQVEPTGHSAPLCIGSTSGSQTVRRLPGPPSWRRPISRRWCTSLTQTEGHRRCSNSAGRRADRCLGSQGNSGGFCFLFGSTVPYSAALLASLYKTHGQFVSASARAIHRDQTAGFLLADGAELLHSAAVSQVARQAH